MTLTQKDLDAISDLVGVVVDDSLEKKLDEKLKNFPTKEEFFSKMDEVIGELKDIREENTALGHQVQRNTSRIEKIEDNLSIRT